MLQAIIVLALVAALPPHQTAAQPRKPATVSGISNYMGGKFP